MEEQYRNVAIAVVEAASALAGLVLVFVGFVYARGEGMINIKRGAQFKHAAQGGVLLFIALLCCVWFALSYAQGGTHADYQIAMVVFRASLVLTGLYALLVFFVHL